MTRKGLMIVFEGVDGSGKTTLIEGLTGCLGDLYPKDQIVYYHYRPGFLEPYHTYDHSEGYSRKPYKKPLSIAKYMAINADFILGYWCKIRRELRQGKLVLFDRYYYDYYLNQSKYRLSISEQCLDFFLRFIPKPSATVLLVGQADIIHQRKNELSVEGIQAQTHALLNQKHKFANPHVISVDKSVEESLQAVAELIRSMQNG